MTFGFFWLLDLNKQPALCNKSYQDNSNQEIDLPATVLKRNDMPAKKIIIVGGGNA